MDDLVLQLTADFPKLKFQPGNDFYWSSKTNEIFYKVKASNKQAAWSLLHETGHALLEHKTYQADIALIKMEVEAWAEAKKLGLKYNIKIGEDHIDKCLDTYRDWLYKRSICPNCNSKSIQQNDFIHYRCFNCHTVWKVSTSRFCRSYRSTKSIKQNQSLAI
jgi:hypothetical protein